MKEAIEHLQCVVDAAHLDELTGRHAELADGVVVVLRSREGLRQPQVRERVIGVELDDLAEDLDRLLVPVLALEARRHFVQRPDRVARQPELLVELRELRREVRVPVFELGDVLGDDLANLLVDRDRFEGEALARVEPPDALVRADRIGIGLHLRLEVADLQQGPSVVRILLDHLLVLDDRLVVSLLLDELLGGDEYLLAVNRHGSGYSSGALERARVPTYRIPSDSATLHM